MTFQYGAIAESVSGFFTHFIDSSAKADESLARIHLSVPATTFLLPAYGRSIDKPFYYRPPEVII